MICHNPCVLEDIFISRRTSDIERQAKSQGLTGDAEIEKVTELNVQSSVAAVNPSPVVSHLVQEGKLMVVGAEYQLVSGVVKWLP